MDLCRDGVVSKVNGPGKNSGFGNGFWEWLHSFLPVTFFRLGFSSSAVVLFALLISGFFLHIFLHILSIIGLSGMYYEVMIFFFIFPRFLHIFIAWSFCFMQFVLLSSFLHGRMFSG